MSLDDMDIDSWGKPAKEKRDAIIDAIKSTAVNLPAPATGITLKPIPVACTEPYLCDADGNRITPGDVAPGATGEGANPSPGIESPSRAWDHVDVTGRKKRVRAQDRETRDSRSTTRRGALSAYQLKEAILASTINMGGRLTMQKVLKRNRSDDVSIPAFILEVIKQLKEEGYET